MVGKHEYMNMGPRIYRVCYATGIRVKTHKLLQVCKQIVTNLFTSCQQVVFALLVPSLL